MTGRVDQLPIKMAISASARTAGATRTTRPAGTTGATRTARPARSPPRRRTLCKKLGNSHQQTNQE